jgi:hypothetical protein
MKRIVVLLLSLAIGILAADYSLAIDRGAFVIGSRVQMHESPAGDSPAKGLIGEGVAVDIIGRTAGPVNVEGFTDYWYQVAYRGRTGWVFGQFIFPSTAGRGLSRIFTAAELIDYADLATRNLVSIRNATLYNALIDESARFTADIKEMSDDPILAAYGNELSPYRLFAVWSLAAGYAGTGDMKNAEKIKKQLLAYDPGAKLPDGTTLGTKIHDLDELIKDNGGITE